MTEKKQRNLRKKRALEEQEKLSDDEKERAALLDTRLIQQQRKRKPGLSADALVAAAVEDELETVVGNSSALAGSYVKEVVKDPEAEDPNMQAYIEQQMAKRLKQRSKTEGDASTHMREGKEGQEDHDSPGHIRTTKSSDLELGGNWVTGILEVQLPVEYKLKNIEETEEAKKQLLRHGGGFSSDSPRIPSASDAKLSRTAFPFNFGRHQLAPVAQKEDSFVAEKMRESFKNRKKKKGA